MERCKVSFSEYRKLLIELFPNKNEEELENYFNLKVNFWKIIIKNRDNLRID